MKTIIVKLTLKKDSYYPAPHKIISADFMDLKSQKNTSQVGAQPTDSPAIKEESLLAKK
jgi:hypothetical protein